MKEIELTIYDQNIWGNMPKSEAISNRNGIIADLVDYHGADVIAFQECNPKTSRVEDTDIGLLLSPEYKEVVTEVGNDNFTPIFYKESRFSVIESGFHLFEGLNDINSKSLTYAVFEERESGVRFGMISTHFWWKSDGKTDDDQRIKNADVLLEYVEKIKSKYDIPVFAMGDLNCGIQSRQSIAPYFFLKEKLLDTREIAPISTDILTHHDLPVKDENGIYHMPGNKTPNRTLDHIFVTKHRNIAVDSFEVNSSDEAYTSSDHFPLIARVRVLGE